MRTKHPAWSWKRRRPRSHGTTAARRLLPDSCIAIGPGRGIKTIPPFTNWPSGGSVADVGREHGAARPSSSRSPTSSGDMGAGPPRRTTAQTMVFPATRRCGAGSGASRQRSSWRGAGALEIPSLLRVRRGALRIRWFVRRFLGGDFSEIYRRFIGDFSEMPGEAL
jgi:hypothetical protein